MPTVLDSTDGIQFEQIASLQPDLIIGMYSNVAQEDYDKLSKIAPTLPAPKDSNDYAVAWDVITTTVGKALGQSEAAQKLVDDVNAQFEEAKTANPGFTGKTGLMATLYEATTSTRPTIRAGSSCSRSASPCPTASPTW